MNFPALVSHMKGLVARINYRDKFWQCLHEGCSCGDSMIGFFGFFFFGCEDQAHKQGEAQSPQLAAQIPKAATMQLRRYLTTYPLSAEVKRVFLMD